LRSLHRLRVSNFTSYGPPGYCRLQLPYNCYFSAYPGGTIRPYTLRSTFSI
jgi:hypothetical protein